MRGPRRVSWFLAPLLALCACGGGGGGAANLGQGPTFTGQIVASKKTAGTVYNMARAGSFMHLAYGATGLVTMRISDLNDLRVMRVTDDIVADDVVVCGGYAFVLTFINPPSNSRVNLLDIQSDPSIPERLSEIQVALRPGTKMACSGSYLFIGGGASGLHLLDFSNPRGPKDITQTRLVDTVNPQRFDAVAFHYLRITGGILRAAVDLGGLPPQDDGPIACQAAPPPAPDCVASPPINCFGKFGLRSFSLPAGKPPACAPDWTDVRIPDSVALDFPPASGLNTSPVNHPIAVAEDARHLYIASSDGRRLTIANKQGRVDFSGPLTGLPQGQISGVDVIGSILLLADGDLRIIDISDPAAPFLASTVYTPGQAFSVIAGAGSDPGTYLAYVADADNGLSVIKISRNAFAPLAGRFVARNVPAPGALAVVPPFETTSPLSGTPALLARTGPQNNLDGVLAAGRLLAAVPVNFGSAAADGTQEGALLSLNSSGTAALPDPATAPTPLAGPFGTSLYTDARLYTQNSLCPYSASDPVCTQTSDAEGHFLEFPLLASLNQALTNLLSYVALSLLPAGVSNVTLQLPGTAVAVPAEQTGPLAPVATPAGVTAVSDGLVFVGSSGLDAQPGTAPAPPFTVTLNPGRAAILDELGSPFAFRSIAGTRPFDPVAYDAAVLAQDIADASPFPLFPAVQLRDNTGSLLDVTGLPGTPQTPDRAPTGVYYADEDLRNPYLSAGDSVPLPLIRTSDRNAGSLPPFDPTQPVNPLTGLPFDRDPGNTTPFSACQTIDTDPFSVNFLLPTYQDERTSLGLCYGIFGAAYGGSGNDKAQKNETATAGFDYYTHNSIYFAATGDGGIVQIDLDGGVSQVAAPRTLQSLVRFPANFTGGAGTQWAPNACSTPPAPGSTPQCPCDPLLSDIAGRDVAFAGSLAARALDCDPYLRMGMVYQPDTRTLFAADPVGRGVRAIYLDLAGSNTPQGVYFSTGSQSVTLGGFLDTPVDVVPAQPLPVSTSQATQSSDLYVADRGAGTLVRMTQAGEFVAVAKPLIQNQPVGKGRIAGLAISPDGKRLFVSLSEGCPVGPTYNASGCIIEVPPF